VIDNFLKTDGQPLITKKCEVPCSLLLLLLCHLHRYLYRYDEYRFDPSIMNRLSLSLSHTILLVVYLLWLCFCSFAQSFKPKICLRKCTVSQKSIKKKKKGLFTKKAAFKTNSNVASEASLLFMTESQILCFEVY